MKKAIRCGMLFLAAVVVCLLPGCGAAEKQRIGVDGYVYVAETIEENNGVGPCKFTVAGDYLYYLDYAEESRLLKRILLEEFLRGGGLSDGETVLTPWGALSSTGGAEYTEEFRGANVYYRTEDIMDYAVDEEGNVYCVLVVETYNTGNGESAGEGSGRNQQGFLYRQYADGETACLIRLPELRILDFFPDLLALDSMGRAYVLTAEAVLAVDTDGVVRGSIPVELVMDTDDKRGKEGRLLEGGDGVVYYVTDETGSSVTETYLLDGGETLRMTPVSFLSAPSGLELYEGMDCILKKTSEGLYRCDVTGNTMEEILKWEDSNLIAEDIYTLAQIAEDRYMVEGRIETEGGGEAESVLRVQRLTRTPVEELPEREDIVIASRSPSPDLRRCVVEFNLASDTYRVSIETYGGDLEGAYMRLDADLVSRDAPDILDFSGLDVSKYAEREMLEDLSLYLERDGEIHRADYLGNLLEAYTVKNRLVCIPKKFLAWAFWWIPQDTGGQGGWSMEDFMALSEQYPDRRVFINDTDLFGIKYLLRKFCAPYYLEQFVDWEAGTCSFDSEAFCRLLDWMAEQNRKNGLVQEGLLERWSLDFGLYGYQRILYGDTTVMRGYPSVGGEVYIADAEDALGILAGSDHKDGAWEFLRYFLLDPGDGNDLPTRKMLLEEKMQEALTEGGTYYFDGMPVEHGGIKKEHADLLMETIESIDFTPRSRAENDIVDVVWEEAQYVFDGNRTAEEAAAFIQNRAELILQEK